MIPSPLAPRPSSLALLISTVALGAFWSAPAEATCPNTLTNADCGTICSLNTTTHDYDCNTSNSGGSGGSVAFAVSDYTSGYHSVWGTDDTATAFCCEVAGNDVDKLILTGTTQNDDLYFQYHAGQVNVTLDDINTNANMEGVINGDTEDDNILGSYSTTATYSETLNGNGGTDEIDGDAGNDTINGNEDGDIIIGGDGNDTINGGDYLDTIYGGSGNDTINGDGEDDTIDGEGGDDTINGGNDDDTIDGGTGDDTIHGNDGADSITGGDNVDLIWGDAGIDYISGGDGNDTIRGGTENDVLCGDANDDSLYGEAGSADKLYGDGGSNSNNGGLGSNDECGAPYPFQPGCETNLTSHPAECP